MSILIIKQKTVNFVSEAWRCFVSALLTEGGEEIINPGICNKQFGGFLLFGIKSFST